MKYLPYWTCFEPCFFIQVNLLYYPDAQLNIKFSLEKYECMFVSVFCRDIKDTSYFEDTHKLSENTEANTIEYWQ